MIDVMEKGTICHIFSKISLQVGSDLSVFTFHILVAFMYEKKRLIGLPNAQAELSLSHICMS